MIRNLTYTGRKCVGQLYMLIKFCDYLPLYYQKQKLPICITLELLWNHKKLLPNKLCIGWIILVGLNSVCHGESIGISWRSFFSKVEKCSCCSFWSQKNVISKTFVTWKIFLRSQPSKIFSKITIELFENMKL